LRRISAAAVPLIRNLAADWSARSVPGLQSQIEMGWIRMEGGNGSLIIISGQIHEGEKSDSQIRGKKILNRL
jgi:hypothetical protein